MSTIFNKLIGVAFSAAILGGAVALADPSGAPLTQVATTAVAGSEGAAVVALVNSGSNQAAPAQPVRVASIQAPTSFAAQSALLRAPAAPRSR
jgi:hypothetical protein